MEQNLANRFAGEHKEALLKLGKLIVNASDPDELSYRASQILGHSLGVSRVGYSAIDPDSDTLHTSKDWCAPGVFSLAGVLQLRDYGSFIESLKRDESIAITDVRDDARTTPAAEALENAFARSFVNVPVVEQGRLRAVMYINYAERREWTDEELLFIHEVARRIRSAMQRLTAEAERSAGEDRLRQADLKRIAAASAAEAKGQLSLAMEGAGLATWFYDPVRQVVGGDLRMAKLFGLAVQDGPAELWISAIHPDDRDRVGHEFAASVEGAPYNTEYRVKHGDGSIRWVRAKARMVMDDGEARMVGICEDFTDRKRIEEDLRSTAKRLGLAQQTGKMAAWEWDLASGNFVWDEGSEWTYGRPPSEMSHVDVIFPYLHEEDREKVRQDLQPAIDGTGTYRSEFRVLWPDGSLHWIQAFGESFMGPQGKPVAIVGINIDITERKSTEQILLQTEKLAAVGRLASSIAHEINNPLESVTNLLYLARNNANSDDLDDYLSLAERELRRVSAIANQTLKFYKQTTGPVPLSCTDLFEETLLLYQGRLVNSAIHVEQRLRADKHVKCLAGEIRQVASNLIGNAIDAMSGGGRLFLRCREATQWKTGQKGIAITVADTGTGMPKQVRDRVFEAFFSTKGIGGTGLGLWVSKELVEKNQGTLSLRSSADSKLRGTVFVLFIPYELAK